MVEIRDIDPRRHGRERLERRTLYAMFRETVRLHGDRPAVRFKRRKEHDYTTYTYREFDERIQAFRRGLDALGLRKGDRIALISHENRVEWAITDLAAQSLGLITVPIYGTLPAAQVAYYVRTPTRAPSSSPTRSSGPRSRSSGRRRAVAGVRDLDGRRAGAARRRRQARVRHRVRAWVKAGRDSDELDEIAAEIDPDDVATLIYTSGTTGDPKGAMLTHVNLLHTPDAVVESRSRADGSATRSSRSCR